MVEKHVPVVGPGQLGRDRSWRVVSRERHRVWILVFHHVVFLGLDVGGVSQGGRGDVGKNLNVPAGRQLSVGDVVEVDVPVWAVEGGLTGGKSVDPLAAVPHDSALVDVANPWGELNLDGSQLPGLDDCGREVELVGEGDYIGGWGRNRVAIDIVDAVGGSVLADLDEGRVHGKYAEGGLVEGPAILQEVVVVKVYYHVGAVCVV